MKGTAILEEPRTQPRAPAALAFDALLEAEQGGLLRLARRLVWDGEEARDLVQATFADAYEKRHSLRDEKAGPAWLRRILVSRAMGHLRRRRVWSLVREALDLGPVPARSPEEHFAGAERWQAFGRALRTLPAQQATAFTLRYLEGLDLDAVAEAMPRAELGLSRGEGEDAFFPPSLEADTAVAVRAGRGSLLNLMGEVRGFSRRDVVVHDETYRPFGTLATWVRPPDSRALETPPFRTAMMPLYPQE